MVEEPEIMVDEGETMCVFLCWFKYILCLPSIWYCVPYFYHKFNIMVVAMHLTGCNISDIQEIYYIMSDVFL